MRTPIHRTLLTIWLLAASFALLMTCPVSSVASTPGNSTTWQIVGTGDFNSDGKPDIVWQDSSTNNVGWWTMNPSGYLTTSAPGLGNQPSTYTPSGSQLAVTSGLVVRAVADFDGDGKPDLALQNTSTGQITIWYMNGTTHSSTGTLGTIPAAGLILVGAADFDLDGNMDIVLQDQTTDAITIWHLNTSGTVQASTATIASFPSAPVSATADWKVLGVAPDSVNNYDSVLMKARPDIVIQNRGASQTSNIGQVALWYMTDNVVTTASNLSSAVGSIDWKLSALAPFGSNAVPSVVYVSQSLSSVGCWILSGATYSSGFNMLNPFDAALSATPATNQVNLTWTASPGATSYNVRRSTTSGGPYTAIASPTATSYTDTTVTSGLTFYYVISAVAASSESVNSTQASASFIPSVPSGIAASPGDSQMSLSWNTCPGATTYNVKRATSSGGTYTTVGSPATNSYVNTGLTNNTAYFYVVSAVNATGESANSSLVAGTPQPLPIVPTWVNGYRISTGDVSAPNLSDGTVGNTSTYYSGTATGNTNGTCAITAIYDLGSVATAIKTVKFTGEDLYTTGTYMVEYSADRSTWTTVQTGAENAIFPTGMSFTQAIVTLGTAHAARYWRVSFEDDEPNGPNVAPVANLSDFRLFDAGGTQVGGGPPPSFGLWASTSTLSIVQGKSAADTITISPSHGYSGSVALTLTGMPTGVTGVYTPTPAVVTTPSSSVSSLAISVSTSATPGTYLLTAQGTSGSIAYIATITLTVVALPTLPTIPASLIGTSGDTQVALSWGTSTGATSYNVKRGSATGGPYSTIATPATTSYTDTALTNGGVYYYVVSGVSGNGEGGNSNELLATPGVTSYIPVWASGYQTGTGYAAAPNLTDVATNDQTTYYTGTAVSGTSTITVKYDLGASSTAVKTVKFTGKVFYGSSSGTNYVLDYSTDGSAWTTVQSGTSSSIFPTGNTFASVTVTLGTAVSARFWRLSLRDIQPTGPPYPGAATLSDVRLFDASGVQLGVSSAPTGLAATVGNTQVLLTWNAVTNTVNYNLKRSTTSGGPYTTLVSQKAMSYTDTGLTNGTTYYYVVSASNAVGESVNSSQVSAVPATGKDFNFLAVNPSISVASIGSSTFATSTLNITQIGGFTSSVSFSASGLPSGITAAFSPTSSTSSTILTLTDGGTASAGNYSVTITGTGGSPVVTRTLSILLTVAVPNLRCTDIYASPSTIRIDWSGGYLGSNNLYFDHYVVHYRGNSISTGNQYFLDAFTFATDGSTSYTYSVDEVITPPQCAWAGSSWGCVSGTYTIPLGSITVIPNKTTGITDNQTVDARWDMRFSTYTALNHNFGSTVYRGGLFAGYSPDQSRMGRSFVRFSTPALPTGKTLWAGSLEAFFTGALVTNTTGWWIGAQQVTDTGWTPANLTWSNAPTVNLAGSTSLATLTYDTSSPTSYWCHWSLSSAVQNSITAPVCVALYSATETSDQVTNFNTWAYFAKKEYVATPSDAPYILYAYGTSP